MFDRFVAVLVGIITGSLFMGTRYDWILNENGLQIPSIANLPPDMAILLKIIFLIVFIGICTVIVVKPSTLKE